jgi:hypothetical protein
VKKFLMVSAVVFVTGFCTGGGRAGHRSCCDCNPPPCAPTVTYVDKVVICYVPVTETIQVPTTVSKVVSREVTTMEKVTEYVPSYKDVTREIFVYARKPKEVEREIFVYKECPAPCPAPCEPCGHGCFVCKPAGQAFPVKIKTLECEETAEKRTIVEHVCELKAVEKLVPVTKVVCETVQETVMVGKTVCTTKAVEKVIRVPVCAPCAP